MAILRRLIFFALASLIYSGTFAAISHSPDLSWRTLSTEHFRIHFHDQSESIAIHLANIAEKVHQHLSSELNWTPASRTEVVLTDESDFANGGADVVPYKFITINISSPLFFPELLDYADWLETVFSHEYVHILQMDKVLGLPKKLQKIFGRTDLLFPNRMQPLWLIEGLATFHETNESRDIGRGQNSFFDMLMRMEVEQGIKPLRQINQDINTWPAGRAPYLYGVHFYRFLRETHGEDVINQLIDNYSRGFLPFFINSNARKVLGKKLPAIWRQFQKYLNNKFQTQIDSIRQRGITATERVSKQNFYRATVKDDKKGQIFLLVDDGKQQSYIAKWPKLGRQIRVTPFAQFDVHHQAGVIVAQPDLIQDSQTFFDLYHIDSELNKVRRISKGKRFTYASWHPNGETLFAVRNKLNRSSILEISIQGEILSEIWAGQFGEVAHELDVSPNGDKLIASIFRPDHGWNLEQIDLKKKRWHRLTNDSVNQKQPRYTSDGKSIVFTADYGGVNNIYSTQLATGKITALTNLLGGGFSPILHENELYYIGYHGKGFDLYRNVGDKVESQNKLTSRPSKKLTKKYDSVEYEISKYKPWHGLKPRSWFPFFVFSDIQIEAGFNSGSFDPLFRHRYNLFASHDTKNDISSYRFDYLYDRWKILLFTTIERRHNLFLQNNIVTDIRQNNEIQLGAMLPFVHFNRRWALQTSIINFKAKGALPGSPLNNLFDFEDNVVGMSLTYDSSHRFPLSISQSDGRSMNFIWENQDMFKSVFAGNTVSMNWREYISLGKEHVLSMHINAARADTGARRFQLGGTTGMPPTDILAGINIGNRFNIRDYPLRGYSNNLIELFGHHLFSGSFEWRFPLIRLERGIMSPPISLQNLSGSVFIDSGDAWNDGESFEENTGAGIELNADIRIGYFFPLLLRLGYASGLNQLGEEQIYLRLGTSF